MRERVGARLALLLPLLLLPWAAAAAARGAADLYRDLCAVCHGPDRLGGSGPPLLPETLGRRSEEDIARILREGLPATQMPAFGDLLRPGEIRELARYLRRPLPHPPRFGMAEIATSRRRFVAEDALPDRPRFKADPLDLFVVVEKGDHHASLLDGDRFVRLARFPTPRALHGGPKFTRDGRFVHFASRDGWLLRYDLWSLQPVVKVRAGVATRNIALTPDGRFLVVADTLPRAVVVLDAVDYRPVEVIPARGADGTPSRVAAVYQAPPRGSVIVALRDVAEAWELVPAADPARRRLRRIPLPEPLDDFLFDPAYRLLVGSARTSRGAWVVALDDGRVIARLSIEGFPHLASGVTFVRDGRRLLITPNLTRPEVTVVDMEDWRVVARIPTLGPGFFARSHRASPHVWVDVFAGPHRDAVHVIDKRTLRIVATLRPAPGRRSAHIEFDREGRHALVSIMEEDGAVVVYDDRTLAEVARIPARHPSGKYNVGNKIRFEEGTSH